MLHYRFNGAYSNITTKANGWRGSNSTSDKIIFLSSLAN